MVYDFLGHLMVHPQKGKIVSYLLFILLRGPRRGGGRGSNCNMTFWIVKWENMNESGPAGIEVVRIFGPNLVCSCFGPQVVHRWKGLPRLVWNWPYTTWPVVCRIVNWMGLTAYNVTSPLNIWTKFCVWLPRRLCGPPSKEENCVVSIGGRLYCKLKFWMVKRENMNESGPAGIEVGRIFYPNSVCSCLGPLVVHRWKETTTFSLILAL